MMTSHRQSGFTLVEMIIVIVITGIIGGIVAVFMRAPVQQYMDVARRADMTDVADTALRRISRDLRLALPNSVRVAGACNGAGSCFIEFLPTGSASCASGAFCPGGGRYRAGAGSVGAGDVLDFDAPDTTFDVLGPMPPMDPATDEIVVYNLGIAGADAYAGDNRSAVAAAGAGGVASIAAFQFPFESPGRRFHVISRPVTYACVPAPGGVGGTLTRHWGYPIAPAQPAALPINNANTAILANNVASCRFTYDSNVVAQRSGLVTMHLTIARDGETVALYSAAHVSNQP